LFWPYKVKAPQIFKRIWFTKVFRQYRITLVMRNLVTRNREMELQSQNNIAADLTLDPADGKWTATYQGKILAKSRDRKYIIDTISRGLNKTAKACGVTHVTELNSGNVGELLQVNGFEMPVKPYFTINERFEFLSNLTQMTIEGTAVASLVTGEGGLGKTHTVFDEINKAGLTYTRDFSPPPIPEKAEKDPDADPDEAQEEEEIPVWVNPGQCHVVKGYSSAKGLFRTLYENNGKLCVFDDCDSILKDANALNILKGALDSSDDRWISWNAEMGRNSGDLPQTFKFTGRVMFISNWSQHRIDPNLKTRCMRVDLTMTASEKIERMRHIIEQDSFAPGIEFSIKEMAVNFLEEHIDVATNLSLRSLLDTVKFCKSNKPNWERQALYTLTA